MYIPSLHPKPNFGLIGHRGIAGLAPENTLFGFNLAAKLGLNWIEFDTRLSKDDEWIILHDDTLERTTNGHGLAADTFWQDLRNLEAGLWFKPPQAHLRIPSLLETLELAHEVGLNVNIEVKGSHEDLDRYLDLFVAFMRKHYTQPLSSPLISSFDLEFIKHLKHALPEFRIGYLVEQFSTETIDIANAFGFSAIHCNIENIEDSHLKHAFSEYLPVLLYTSNNPAEANQWLKKGVSGIFTDRPDLLHPTVGETYQSLQRAVT